MPSGAADFQPPALPNLALTPHYESKTREYRKASFRTNWLAERPVMLCESINSANPKCNLVRKINNHVIAAKDDADWHTFFFYEQDAAGKIITLSNTVSYNVRKHGYYGTAPSRGDCHSSPEIKAEKKGDKVMIFWAKNRKAISDDSLFYWLLSIRDNATTTPYALVIPVMQPRIELPLSQVEGKDIVVFGAGSRGCWQDGFAGPANRVSVANGEVTVGGLEFVYALTKDIKDAERATAGMDYADPAEKIVKGQIYGNIQLFYEGLEELGPAAGKHVNALDRNLLYQAVYRQQYLYADSLLKVGANPNRLEGGCTPVCEAARTRNIQILELLLRNGGDPNITGPIFLGNIPLILAIENSDVASVKLLLQYGAQKENSGSGRTAHVKIYAVESAIIRGNDEIINLLMTQQDLRKKIRNNESFWSIAAENLNLNALRKMMELGQKNPQPDMPGSECQTKNPGSGVFSLAEQMLAGCILSQPQFEVLFEKTSDTLVHHLATLGVQLPDPVASMHRAAAKMQIGKVLFIGKNYSIDINTKNSFGDTAGHLAIKAMLEKKQPSSESAMRQEEFFIGREIRALRDGGFDVNQQNAMGDTLLMLAAQRNRRGAIKALLENGADTSLKNRRGLTVFDTAGLDAVNLRTLAAYDD